ncbi:MAG: DUF3006 domain-containing protein [Oscillospiraceae bacterium]|nr:DUF3006 domain-containing protein [Oscillospiraceae bacterium]
MVTVDRFEGDFAVVETENRETVNLPRILVPDASEGDRIRIELAPDTALKKEIEDFMENLFE